MKKVEEKTNVMRILEQKKINFNVYDYSSSEAISGLDVASYLNQDPNKVFKTLVTTGKSNNHYVFLVPVSSELDLKKAANSVGEKNIEMLKSKDLLDLTGYIHGGCSPIGMKKKFPTFIEESAQLFDHIFISAGKVGLQLKISPFDLKDFLECDFVSVIR